MPFKTKRMIVEIDVSCFPMWFGPQHYKMEDRDGLRSRKHATCRAPKLDMSPSWEWVHARRAILEPWIVAALKRTLRRPSKTFPPQRTWGTWRHCAVRISSGSAFHEWTSAGFAFSNALIERKMDQSRLPAWCIHDLFYKSLFDPLMILVQFPSLCGVDTISVS